MTIKIGEKLPSATFKEKTADGPVETTTDALFGGKKVVLFAVPGAFTPTCSLNHLPGYLENRDTIRYRRRRRQ
jgi:glutaredoxin/glutathione-dependent peroxiredoxin